MPEMPLTEPLAVTLRVVEVLEALQVPYFIGGSLASAVHGVVRTTMDVDLVAALRPEHVAPLAAQLGATFYADEAMIRDAVARHSSFNLVHLDSMFKVDIFVTTGRPFERAQFERRALQTLSQAPPRAAYVTTAEDIILAKLEWYRQGGELSERQWRDVVNVIKVQGEALDLAYLRRWAEQLRVADLLERVLEESRA
ncbi:MAG: hypothetical protein JXA21_19675 [Anaerolineae bacterium]|nr:hypothetical protein [Anaerolineae bacterium]